MKKYINGLDGIRGIAALGIIAYHVIINCGFKDHNKIFDMTFGEGGVLVELFFIISAFSLMYVYFDKFIDNKINWEKFYFKRFLRIIPLFIIAMLFYSFIDYTNNIMHSKWEWIGDLTLTFALFSKYQGSIVGGGWTMSIQMIFYCLFPFFIVTLKTKKRAWVTFFISFALQLAYDNFFVSEYTITNINIVRQWVFFVTGGLLFHYAEYFMKIKSKKKKIIISSICILFMILGFVFYMKYQTIVCIFSFSSWIILQLLEVDYICKWRPIRFLGKIGYELYLFNLAVITIFNKFAFENLIIENICEHWFVRFVITYLIVAIFTFLISIIVYYLYKKLLKLVTPKIKILNKKE